MQHRKAIQLLYKYLYGKPGIEEKAMVDKWYDSIEDKHSGANEQQDITVIKEQLFQRIQNVLESSNKVVPFYKRPVVRMAAAASFVIILGVVGWLFFNRLPGKDKMVHTGSPSTTNDVPAPVVNKAVITFADGRTIAVDSIRKGVLATEGNTTVAKLDSGQIIYQANGEATIKYNTLTVPKGSKPVQMILADGSKVWLNVASSITYPTVFAGKERKVSMTGEAYFEVSHDKTKPFIVDVNRQSLVEVLGTHFDIYAYDDEGSIRTTLLEGKVKVQSVPGSAGSHPQSVILKPGEQVSIHRPELVEGSHSFHMFQPIPVQTDEVIAWKNGLFRFTSLEIQDIMRQIARWYDVEIEYTGAISHEHFSGLVSRNSNISEVLKIMEQTGIQFKIEGKKVTVQF